MKKINDNQKISNIKRKHGSFIGMLALSANRTQLIRFALVKYVTEYVERETR